MFGSGPGGRDAYDWPARFAAAGFAFYAYDCPGCGESTGDRQAMDFADRADETLSAVAAFAAHPAIDPDHIALFGGSHGGRIAPAAGCPLVAAAVTFSGPGVSPAVQEEYRIGRALTAAGLNTSEVAESMAYTRFMYDGSAPVAPAPRSFVTSTPTRTSRGCRWYAPRTTVSRDSTPSGGSSTTTPCRHCTPYGARCWPSSATLTHSCRWPTAYG